MISRLRPLHASRLLSLPMRRPLTRCCTAVVATNDDSALDPEERIDIARVLPGLRVHPLAPGSTPMEAFLLVKLLDADGDVNWAYRTTNRLNREELLGALSVHVAVLTKELRDEWLEE